MIKSLASPSFLDEATNDAALIVVGATMDIGSIPFFITGAKNKRKALAVTLKSDFIPQLQKGSLVRVPVPALDLAIRLLWKLITF